MRDKFNVNLFTNVVLLVVGIIFICFYNATSDLLDWAARIIGILFLLPSLVYIAMVAMQKADERTNIDYVGIFPAIGGMCFAIIMIIKPTMFNSVISMLLGVLLIVLGGFHIVYLLMRLKSNWLRTWHFFLPFAVAACGVLILFIMRDKPGRVLLISGICFLLFNFMSLCVYFAERKQRKAIEQEEALLAEGEEESTYEGYDETEPNEEAATEEPAEETEATVASENEKPLATPPPYNPQHNDNGGYQYSDDMPQYSENDD